MREITLLQSALIEARRITRDASIPLPTDTLTSRITRLIAAQRNANSLLLRAKAESQLATLASEVVLKSLHSK